MSQSLHNNLIHCVFHKHSSAVQILQDDLLRLNTCVMSICNEMHCPCLIANGPGDHIHILFALSSQVTLANLIKEVKRMSCQYLKTLRTNYYKHFRWQNGYGAFSVSGKHKDLVFQYIATQEEHHKKHSFKEEFETLVQNANITTYDPHYYWAEED